MLGDKNKPITNKETTPGIAISLVFNSDLEKIFKKMVNSIINPNKN